MADLMSVTFSDVVRVHWRKSHDDGGLLVHLVNTWKPDIVLVTVAERSFRGPQFASFLQYAPPPKAGTAVGNTPRTAFEVSGLNGLERVDGDDSYQVVSDAPSLALSAPTDILLAPGGVFSMRLTCLDNTASLPVQLFWKPARVARFKRDQTQRFLHLGEQSHVPVEVGQDAVVRDLRVDLKANGFCQNFRWGDLTYARPPAVPG